MLPVDTYETIWSVGSIQPRLNGLPKTHKDNVPLRLISSMIGSVDKVVVCVVEHYTSNYVKDAFTFTNSMQNCSTEAKFIWSFDIRCLFTCVCNKLLIFGLMCCPPLFHVFLRLSLSN